MVIFHSYVSLPEGIVFQKTITIGFNWGRHLYESRTFDPLGRPGCENWMNKKPFVGKNTPFYKLNPFLDEHPLMTSFTVTSLLVRWSSLRMAKICSAPKFCCGMGEIPMNCSWNVLCLNPNNFHRSILYVYCMSP